MPWRDLVPRAARDLVHGLLAAAFPGDDAAGERVRGWLGPRRGEPRGDPRALAEALALGRRPGRAGPWLPPWVTRWLRSPGCRAWAVLLAAHLRAAGHDAEVVLGVAGDGAHAWVECRGRAYDLDAPAGVEAAARRARYTLCRRWPQAA